jgi:dipeptidase
MQSSTILVRKNYKIKYQIAKRSNIDSPSQGLLWLSKSRSQKNRQVPFSGASFESQGPVWEPAKIFTRSKFFRTKTVDDCMYHYQFHVQFHV